MENIGTKKLKKLKDLKKKKTHTSKAHANSYSKRVLPNIRGNNSKIMVSNFIASSVCYTDEKRDKWMCQLAAFIQQQLKQQLRGVNHIVPCLTTLSFPNFIGRHFPMHERTYSRLFCVKEKKGKKLEANEANEKNQMKQMKALVWSAVEGSCFI